MFASNHDEICDISTLKSLIFNVYTNFTVLHSSEYLGNKPAVGLFAIYQVGFLRAEGTQKYFGYHYQLRILKNIQNIKIQIIYIMNSPWAKHIAQQQNKYISKAFEVNDSAHIFPLLSLVCNFAIWLLLNHQQNTSEEVLHLIATCILIKELVKKRKSREEL